MSDPLVPFDKAASFAQKFGRKETLKRLSMLAHLQQFRNMLNTPVGAELLKDIDEQIKLLNEKVVLADDATNEDKMLLRAYITIGQRWAERLARFDATLEQMKGGGE